MRNLHFWSHLFLIFKSDCQSVVTCKLVHVKKKKVEEDRKYFNSLKGFLKDPQILVPPLLFI